MLQVHVKLWIPVLSTVISMYINCLLTQINLLTAQGCQKPKTMSTPREAALMNAT